MKARKRREWWVNVRGKGKLDIESVEDLGLPSPAEGYALFLFDTRAEARCNEPEDYEEYQQVQIFLKVEGEEL